MSELDVDDLISTSINLTPGGAQAPNLSTVMVIGDSNVIDTKERYRAYSSLTGVAGDFGTTAPEYLAAAVFFGQTPSPTSLFIGRWAKTATSGLLIGGPLTPQEQQLANWTAVSAGSFKIAVDGAAAASVSNINLTSETNLNGVASAITAAMASASVNATCTWNGSQFQFASHSTGQTSSIAPLTAVGTGTDISAMLLCTAGTDTYEVDGIAAETAIQCLTLIDSEIPVSFFGLNFAAGANNADIADSDHLAIAAYIEGLGGKHLYGLTTAEAAALTTSDTTSIGYQLKQLNYNWSFCQYSSQNPYASLGFFAIGVSVNYTGSNTTTDFMWKSLASVVPESLSETQAAALNASHYNYYATFNNGSSITVNGYVASGSYIDTVWNCAWLKGAVQTNMFNILLSNPKVPQTDAGMQTLAAGAAAACQQGVTNGMLAPGIWNAGGFGQLVEGAFVAKGYYIYVPPISSQAQADRAARKAVPFQIAAKLAGAINSASVMIDVNP